MPDSQLNKLKLVIKNATEVTLKLTTDMIVDSNNKLIFHKNYY